MRSRNGRGLGDVLGIGQLGTAEGAQDEEVNLTQGIVLKGEEVNLTQWIVLNNYAEVDCAQGEGDKQTTKLCALQEDDLRV